MAQNGEGDLIQSKLLLAMSDICQNMNINNTLSLNYIEVGEYCSFTMSHDWGGI